jgi:predicted transcriptional regulator
MSESVPFEVADVLLKRYECLQALSEYPQTKPEIVESLNIPRSTLDNIIRDLEQSDLAKYHNGKWQLTLLGQILLNEHTRYVEQLEVLTDASSVLNELPQDTPVDRRFLVDVDVHVATTPVPDEVMQVFLDAVRSASYVRGVTPLAMAGHADSFYHAATQGSNARSDIILPLETFERLQALDPDSTNRVLEDENITLYHADIPFTFSLWITDDDHAGIIVYADQGVQGILINNTNDALNWATSQYNRIRKDAEPIFNRGSAKHSTDMADFPRFY